MKKTNPNRIHELRIARQWSQSELGEAVGAHWVTISKLERGQMQLTQDWMNRLAEALAVEPAEIISDAPLKRTVYVNGNIHDRGVADESLEITPNSPLPYTIDLGIQEPDRTEWYFINTDSYYPLLSNGDLVRFTYPAIFVPEHYVGRLCLVKVAENPSKKLVGVLNPSASAGLYDLQIVGSSPMRGIRVLDLAVASLAVMAPVHLTDEDGYPLP